MDNIFVYSWEEEQKDIVGEEIKEVVRKEKKLEAEIKDYRKAWGIKSIVDKIKYSVSIK